MEGIVATIIVVAAAVLFAIGIKKHLDAKKSASRPPQQSGGGGGRGNEPGTTHEN